MNYSCSLARSISASLKHVFYYRSVEATKISDMAVKGAKLN
jgi:hypothetical protein